MNRCNPNRLRGMVYTMTNETVNNIVAFRRYGNGTVEYFDTYATGGSGTGVQVVDPLVSQGSLILARCNCFLLAVNAGSNTISCFKVSPIGELTLMDVVSSNGVGPNSLTSRGSLVYVTNVGDTNNAANVTGFALSDYGQLLAISGSTVALSTSNPQPTCVSFSPDFSQIVVSELDTDKLTVFNVNVDGSLSTRIVNSSSGDGPFGSVFVNANTLLVVEAGSAAVSSYRVGDSGSLSTISASVLNGQQATCWIALHPNQQIAYTSNTGSGTISIYRVFPNGVVRLAGIAYSNRCDIVSPIDLAVSQDGCYLYVLNGDLGTISEFAIREQGCILIPTQILANSDIPRVGAQGLAVI